MWKRIACLVAVADSAIDADSVTGLTESAVNDGLELPELLSLVGRDSFEVLPLLPKRINLAIEILTEVLLLPNPKDDFFQSVFELVNLLSILRDFWDFLNENSQPSVCWSIGQDKSFKDATGLCKFFEDQSKLKSGSTDRCSELLKPIYKLLYYIGGVNIVTDVLKSVTGVENVTIRHLPELVRFLYSFGAPSLLFEAKVLFDKVKSFIDNAKKSLESMTASNWKNAKIGFSTLWNSASKGIPATVLETIKAVPSYSEFISILQSLLDFAKKNERAVLIKTAAKACGPKVSQVCPGQGNSCSVSDLLKINANINMVGVAGLMHLEAFLSGGTGEWLDWTLETCKSQGKAHEAKFLKFNSLGRTLQAVRAIKPVPDTFGEAEFNKLVEVLPKGPNDLSSVFERMGQALTYSVPGFLDGLSSFSGGLNTDWMSLTYMPTPPDSQDSAISPWKNDEQISYLGQLFLILRFDLWSDLPELPSPLYTMLVLLERFPIYAAMAPEPDFTKAPEALSKFKQSWDILASFASRVRSCPVELVQRELSSKDETDEAANEAARVGVEKLTELGLATPEETDQVEQAIKGLFSDLQQLRFTEFAPQLVQFFLDVTNVSELPTLHDFARYIWFFGVPLLNYPSFIAKLNEHLKGIISEFEKHSNDYLTLAFHLPTVFLQGSLDTYLQEKIFHKMKGLVTEILKAAQSNESEVKRRRGDKSCRKAKLERKLETYKSWFPKLLLAEKKDFDNLVEVLTPVADQENIGCAKKNPKDLARMKELDALSEKMKDLRGKQYSKIQEHGMSGLLRSGWGP